jgi:hypothetical protein
MKKAEDYNIPQALMIAVTNNVSSNLRTLNDRLASNVDQEIEILGYLTTVQNRLWVEAVITKPYRDVAKSQPGRANAMNTIADAIEGLHVLCYKDGITAENLRFDELTPLGRMEKGSEEYMTLEQQYLDEISSFTKTQIVENGIILGEEKVKAQAYARDIEEAKKEPKFVDRLEASRQVGAMAPAYTGTEML